MNRSFPTKTIVQLHEQPCFLCFQDDCMEGVTAFFRDNLQSLITDSSCGLALSKLNGIVLMYMFFTSCLVSYSCAELFFIYLLCIHRSLIVKRKPGRSRMSPVPIPLALLDFRSCLLQETKMKTVIKFLITPNNLYLLSSSHS